MTAWPAGAARKVTSWYTRKAREFGSTKMSSGDLDCRAPATTLGAWFACGDREKPVPLPCDPVRMDEGFAKPVTYQKYIAITSSAHMLSLEFSRDSDARTRSMVRGSAVALGCRVKYACSLIGKGTLISLERGLISGAELSELMH